MYKRSENVIPDVAADAEGFVMVDEVMVGVVSLHGVEVGAVAGRAVVHVVVDHVVCQVPNKCPGEFQVR